MQKLTPSSSHKTPHDIITSDEGFFNLDNALAGKSSETQRKYKTWITLFYDEVADVETDPKKVKFETSHLPIRPFLDAVTPAEVETWLGRYASAGHSKSGLGQARAAVVFMTRMLVLARQAPSHVWHDLKLVTLPTHAASAAYGESVGARGPRWLSPNEVRLLLKAVQGHENEPRAKRDFALIWLMVTLGMRRDEVAGLRWDYLTRRGGNWVLRIRGKRNKWRAVGVPNETILALQPWVNALLVDSALEKNGLPSGYILRRVYRGGHIKRVGITGNAVWRIVTDGWQATGLPGELAPHDLRRTAAAIALEGGAQEREIQQMLGHSSIETTHRYLAPLRENTATYRIAQIVGDVSSIWDG